LELMGNDKIRRILIMSDSPLIMTGFANVCRHIGTYLHQTGKWEVHCIGWFHRPDAIKNYKIPFPVYTTATNQTKKSLPIYKMRNGDAVMGIDKYAQYTFTSVIEQVRPEIVLTIGDVWMIEHVSRCPHRDSFTWVAYPPIDGDPYPTRFQVGDQAGQFMDVIRTFTNIDVLVAFGEYGMDEINRVGDHHICSLQIPHGVDSQVYRPLGNDFKIKQKAQMFGLDPKDFFIGQVSRNQPRKCPNLTIRAISEFIHTYKPKRNVKFYFHGALVDKAGWDIMQLAVRYGIEDHILLNKNLDVGMGTSEHVLNAIYNCMDIHILPTTGEGFGLPLLECMSSGTPLITTNVSAHPEFCKGNCELVDIPESRMIEETKSNIRRGFVDPLDLAASINKLYRRPDLRKDLSKKGRAKAESMDWNIICEQWEMLLDALPIRSSQYKSGMTQWI